MDITIISHILVFVFFISTIYYYSKYIGVKRPKINLIQLLIEARENLPDTSKLGLAMEYFNQIDLSKVGKIEVKIFKHWLHRVSEILKKY